VACETVTSAYTERVPVDLDGRTLTLLAGDDAGGRLAC
jgi:hypothetical protein